MGGIPLPDGAGVLTQSNTKTDQAKELELANKSFFQRMKEFPGDLYQSFTGEDIPIEFPNIPEVTSLADSQPDFMTGLIANAKIMMARDDRGKTEIIKETFKQDPRWGGAFEDKYNNPIIVWDGDPYYINKPGFSGQDIGTFIGEIIKYFPATKFVAGAKDALSTAIRGTGAYALTEAGSKGLETAITPKTVKSEKQKLGDVAEDIAVSTAIGVATDAVLPGAVKLAKKSVNLATEKIDSFPKFSPEIIQGSKYPLLQGQRGAEVPDRKTGPTEKVTSQLETEDRIRRAPSTDPNAASIIRGFDENQLTEIRKDARALQEEFGSGRVDIIEADDLQTAVAEDVQSLATATAQQLKKQAGDSYTVVQGADFQPVMSPEGIIEVSNNALNKILGKGEDQLGITQRELTDMKLLKRELDYLKKINKIAKNPRARAQPLNILHGYQKSLNRAYRSAEQGSPEQLALGKIKEIINQSIFEGIESGFITGDEAVLKSLKEATGLYKQYMGLTGKGAAKDSQEKAANKILEMISNPNYTPKQVVNSFFGHAKFNPNQSMGLVLNKLKTFLPKEQYQEVVALIKDGVLEKAFSGSGKSGVTRTNIVNNYDDIFVKNKKIINLLFSPDEISKIKQFRKDVMPTLWAEIKLNPSGSGYTVLSGLAQSNLVNYFRLIPIIGTEMVQAGQRIGATKQALNATRQYLNRVNRPLFSATVQATVRPTAVEADDPDVINFLRDIPSQTREKIMQTVN